MNKRFSKIIGQGVLFSALALMWACDPAPRRTLTPEEKQADMMWLYSKFGANYAPMKYKEELHGINFQELKEKYLVAAGETQNNDEFYALVHKFVAEFKDAHLGATITASGRKGRETVKYLGFTGRRVGDLVEITEMAPTQGAESSLPIAVGSMISKINGVTVKEYVLKEAVKYRDLGQEESNLTAHMGTRLFTKLSVSGPLPQEKDITLTIKEGETEKDVTLPWIEKDLFSYIKDMRAASAGNSEEAKAKTSTEMFLSGDKDTAQIPFSLLDFNGVQVDLGFFNKKSTLNFKERVDSFKLPDNIASWTMKSKEINVFNGTKNTLEALAQVRAVPPGALAIPEAKTFPSYVWPQTVSYQENGETKEKKVMMGYILLNTFSPGGGNPFEEASDPVAEVKATLAAFQNFGVEDIVIDTINNGGGSLFLLMELAQALSKNKVIQPNIQFGTNEGWIDSLEDWADNAPSDAEKEMAKRLLTEVMSSEAQGLRITPKSTAYNLEVLMPWQLKVNDSITKDFNIVLLVNEMCASSCDIFAGVLQDNKMATIVGQRTMGAGGNVVSYWQAPNSNMDVRQVESLVVRTNGQYIENVGVTPDVEMNVSETAPGMYEDVRAKAVELLSKRHAQAPAATVIGANSEVWNSWKVEPVKYSPVNFPSIPAPAKSN